MTDSQMENIPKNDASFHCESHHGAHSEGEKTTFSEITTEEVSYEKAKDKEIRTLNSETVCENTESPDEANPFFGDFQIDSESYSDCTEQLSEAFEKSAEITEYEKGELVKRDFKKEPLAGDVLDKSALKKSFSKIFSRILTLLLCSIFLFFCKSGIKYFTEKNDTATLLEIAMGEVFSGVYTPQQIALQEEAEPEQTPSEENTEKIPEQNVTGELFPIEKANLSVSGTNLLSINNQTRFSVKQNEQGEIGLSYPTAEEIYKLYGKSAPVVLIIHTHGTEAYSENGENYSADNPFRSTDKTKNVVAVGKVMAEVFKSAGINVIHDTEMYDSKSYKDSYNRSRAATATHLENNPSISYIFDVHRDAVIRDDKTAIAPIFTYEGADAAQVMLVVGTDQDGADHKNWRENLALAFCVQREFGSTASYMARNINLRSSAFNQGLSSGALLLEMGSCGNTLTQAKRSAVLCAVSLTRIINGEDHPVAISKLMTDLAS